MKNKSILIGLGVLAVAGVSFYLWKNKKSKTSGADGEDESSNYVGSPTGGLGGASAGAGIALQGVGAPSFPSPIGTPPAGVVSSGGAFTPVGGGSSILPTPPNPNFGFGLGGFGGFGGFGWPVYMGSPNCYMKNANGVTVIAPCGQEVDL